MCFTPSIPYQNSSTFAPSAQVRWHHCGRSFHSLGLAEGWHGWHSKTGWWLQHQWKICFSTNQSMVNTKENNKITNVKNHQPNKLLERDGKRTVLHGKRHCKATSSTLHGQPLVEYHTESTHEANSQRTWGSLNHIKHIQADFITLGVPLCLKMLKCTMARNRGSVAMNRSETYKKYTEFVEVPLEAKWQSSNKRSSQCLIQAISMLLFISLTEAYSSITTLSTSSSFPRADLLLS